MKIILCLFMLFSGSAFATSVTDKYIDNIQAHGGTSLAVPATGSNIVSDSASQTLTNKTISGSSNTITNISASAVSSGQVGVANGGTGASTLTANGVLQGNGTSAVTAVTGSQYQVLQYGASGVPVSGAVNLNQSAAVTGSLGVVNGGTGASTLTSGSVVVGNGTSAVSLVAPGSSGNVLTSNGTTWTSSAPSSSAPTLTGTQASPYSVTATTGIALTTPTYFNLAFITSSGAVTVTATPSITACTAAGQQLIVLGESSNVVTLQDNSALSGSKLNLNGNWTSGLNQTLTLVCDGNGFWNEVTRSN